MRGFLPYLLLALATALPLQAAEDAWPELIWVELLPDEDLVALFEMPPLDHGGGDEEGTQPLLRNNRQYSEAPADRFQAALSSIKVKPELDGKQLKLAGFVVPLEYDEEQRVTTFFLVPYFGACIHLPPPPPNQLVHVRYARGLELHSIYEPYYVYGKLSTTLVDNGMATAAYSLEAVDMQPYVGDEE